MYDVWISFDECSDRVGPGEHDGRVSPSASARWLRCDESWQYSTTMVQRDSGEQW